MILIKAIVSCCLLVVLTFILSSCGNSGSESPKTLIVDTVIYDKAGQLIELSIKIPSLNFSQQVTLDSSKRFLTQESWLGTNKSSKRFVNIFDGNTPTWNGFKIDSVYHGPFCSNFEKVCMIELYSMGNVRGLLTIDNKRARLHDYGIIQGKSSIKDFYWDKNDSLYFEPIK